MKNKNQIVFGAIIVFFGLMLLAGAIFKVDLWALLCPTALIVIGVWMLIRPRISGSDASVHFFFAHNIKRRETWQVTDEEFWGFATDARLDMSTAEIPLGETKLRLFGFANDVRLTVPEDVGVSINSMAIVTEDRILGNKQDHIFYPLDWKSSNYTSAERKIHIESYSFVFEIRIEHSQSAT